MPLVDFKGAAERFGKSTEWVKHLRDDGRIPYIKVGEAKNASVLFDTDDIDRFIAAHKVPAKVGPLAEPEPATAEAPARRRRAS